MVGVTLSKLRLWSGQCACALHIQGCCSNLRGVRSELGPEWLCTAMWHLAQKPLCGGPLPCKAPRVPQCVSDLVCLCCLKDGVPIGLLPDTQSVWTLRISKMLLIHRDKGVKRVYPPASLWLYSLPLQIRIQSGVPSCQGSSSHPITVAFVQLME